MPTLNDTIGGKYLIGRLLGSGGMGEVFEAKNVNTGLRVAIKTLHAKWTENQDVVQRFLQEARATTRIEHPNVVRVLDLDVDAPTNMPYIVQEFLVGETLQEHLAKQPGVPLDPRVALELFVPVMEALAEAHRVGITHRDLKPANIFLTRSRSGAVLPKVIDFGIAKIRLDDDGGSEQTRTGVTMGTPSYMSPEQARGDSSLDARSDVWSLGVVLYETLSRRLPYDAPNAHRMIGMIQYEDPVPLALRVPTIPPSVAALLDAVLRRDRAQRLPSMQAFLEGACACLETLPPAAPTAGAAAPRPFASVPSFASVPGMSSSHPSAPGMSSSQPSVPGAVPYPSAPGPASQPHSPTIAASPSVPHLASGTMPSVPAWSTSQAAPAAPPRSRRGVAIFVAVASLLALTATVGVRVFAAHDDPAPRAAVAPVRAPQLLVPAAPSQPAPVAPTPAAPVVAPSAVPAVALAAAPSAVAAPPAAREEDAHASHRSHSTHRRRPLLNAATDYP